MSTTLGARIKLARELANISRKDAAVKAGMAYSTLADIENEAAHSCRKIVALANALGVSAKWLESETGPMLTYWDDKHDVELKASPEFKYREEYRFEKGGKGDRWEETVYAFFRQDGWLIKPNTTIHLECLRLSTHEGRYTFTPQFRISKHGTELLLATTAALLSEALNLEHLTPFDNQSRSLLKDKVILAHPGELHLALKEANLRVSLAHLSSLPVEQNQRAELQRDSLSHDQLETDELEVLSIPHMNGKARGGGGGLAPLHEYVVGSISVTTAWLRRRLPSITAKRNLAVVEAYGRSMEPTLMSGDLMIVDTGVNKADVNGIYILLRQNTAEPELMVKRIQLKLNGGMIVKSDNSIEYEPETFGPHEVATDVKVLGRVVWIWAGREA